MHIQYICSSTPNYFSPWPCAHHIARCVLNYSHDQISVVHCGCNILCLVWIRPVCLGRILQISIPMSKKWLHKKTKSQAKTFDFVISLTGGWIWNERTISELPEVLSPCFEITNKIWSSLCQLPSLTFTGVLKGKQAQVEQHESYNKTFN